MINTVETAIAAPTLAIVSFGPPTATSGFRPAEYYQVTIDPNTCSPSGEYIRFGLYQGDEIVGWQRVQAMTVIEELGPSEAPMHEGVNGYVRNDDATVTIMKLE